MGAQQREQIRQVLEYKAASAERSFEDQRKELYARHSADGELQSGSTIRQIIRIMEEVGGTFITECIEQVRAVAQDPEAFVDLLAGFDVLWNHLAAELHSTIKLAGGKSVRDDEADSTSCDARRLFEKSGSLLKKRLEHYRFTFTKLAVPMASPLQPTRIADPDVVSPKRSAKGGRPLAEHWDDMWAAIAFALYTGDLVPKSQADIENEMLVWLEAQGLGAATSTVRGRARRLWDRLQDEN